MEGTVFFRAACVSLFFVVGAAYSAVRDEIFHCDLVKESNDKEHHKILRDTDAYHIYPLALRGIPRTDSESKKDRDFFVKAISAAIRKVNEFVLEQRKLVLLVQEKRRQSQKLTAEESVQFVKICHFYQTTNINELLLRVAPVPVSLAVAQAALESRFGSDKLIHKLNAYFGLAQSETRLVRFDTLFNSVIAYVKTLNVNPVYREFREQRAVMMKKEVKLDGVKLAAYIGKYGEDKNYRKLVSEIIRLHKLSALD
jgi:Bax protein